MKRLILATLLLSGCTQTNLTDLTQASALPSYIVLGQAALDRNAREPLTPSQVRALKMADDKAFPTVLALDAEQHRRALDIHDAIQGLPEE